MKLLRLRSFYCIVILQCFLLNTGFAQYKEYKLSPDGDTLNAITKAGSKEGKWVIHHDELRGEPGYEEEGMYRKNQREGVWRRYTIEGDIIGVENYLNGGKDGIQQYFTRLGNLEREESWKGYNPNVPYDTIPVYGTGSNEIVSFKIVKAEPYSVKHGDWKFYDPETGEMVKKVTYSINNIVEPGKPKQDTEVAATQKKKAPDKTPEMLEWEKKNKGKKNVIRDGKTGL